MKKALLLILDGFGHNEKREGNAIAHANTPNWDRFLTESPHSLIQTSGEAVGLPDGVMGNSEVGHITIGSGQIIYQDLTRITKTMKAGKFKELALVQELSQKNGVLHLIGLLSDGGVHSHIEHLKGMIATIKELRPDKRIFIHAFTDGRDTSPTSGKVYLDQLKSFLSGYSDVEIVTIIGRFYAMDRDKRWERVKVAYDAIADGTGSKTDDLGAELQRRYEKEETDEFIKPIIARKYDGLESGDQFLFYNFRSDRARELSIALTDAGFSEFETRKKIKAENYYTFTQYKEDFKFPVLFPKETPTNTLGELVSKNGGRQLRIAETEKYAHVTYFFNGGLETQFEGEERILVPSPKEINTYDEKPEMSIYEVTDKLTAAIQTKKFDLIVCNFANGDMVGHTGNFDAAVKAVEAIDNCLGKIGVACHEAGYDIFITADHGNCESMLDETDGQVLTQHSTNPVPLVWVKATGADGVSNDGRGLSNGGLSDISPTILDFMGLEKPSNLSGGSLIRN